LVIHTSRPSQIAAAGPQASPCPSGARPGRATSAELAARMNRQAAGNPLKVFEKSPRHVRPPIPRQCKRRSHDMATRPEIKVKKSEPEDTTQEAPNQKVKKEAGNYRLQVDRQTKAFYMTEEAAETAGLIIKKGHPVVQVSIYNSAEGVNKIIELPK
jgi:hypothetical protein